MASDSHPSGCRKMPTAELDGFYAIELFCGSGNLTLAMKHFLPNSCGVDNHTKGRKLKVIPLDLSTASAQQLVTEWCTSLQCIWVHFGVPCGTASRARLRRLSRRYHGPSPLRTARYPDGLPNLKPALHARVLKANALYVFMVELILKLYYMDCGKSMDQLFVVHELLEKIAASSCVVLRAT